MTKRSVFILADFQDDDPYLTWLRPFLTSYYKFNTLPLVCIPCGFRTKNEDRFQRTMKRQLRRLMKEQLYQSDAELDLHIDRDDFEWCGNLSTRYLKYIGSPVGLMREYRNPYVENVFRKLCIYVQQKYDEVLYLDIDSVVLKNLEPLFGFLKEYDIAFGGQTDKEWVYDGAVDPLITFGREVPYYNSGMVLVRKGLFTKEKIDQTTEFGIDSKLLSKQGYDQGIVNLAIMTTGARHIDMESAIWGKDQFEVEDGRVMGKPKCYVVHWAGAKNTVEDVPHIDLIRQFDATFVPWNERRRHQEPPLARGLHGVARVFKR